ncbi:hypothetical protein MN608_08056 [Microdochium nivale]|nr:hypothetical protein MN608_08056 [Microdochium nivale]
MASPAGCKREHYSFELLYERVRKGFFHDGACSLEKDILISHPHRAKPGNALSPSMAAGRVVHGIHAKPHSRINLVSASRVPTIPPC